MSTSDNSSKKPPSQKPSTQESKKGAPLQSVAFLLLIVVALYYTKPYLTGEKSINSIDEMLIDKKSEQSPTPKDVQVTLKIPRVSDRSLRPLLAEFKERYELAHSDKYLRTSLPEVVTILPSKEGSQLLIEIEYKNPETKQIISEDIVFNTDAFGRLVTEGKYASIKLHPKL